MSSFKIVRDFRATPVEPSRPESLRAGAPLAIGLGAVACILGFSLLGPFVSKSVADDAGIFAFLFGSQHSVVPKYQPYVSRGLAPRVDPLFVARSRTAKAAAARAKKLARRHIELVRTASHGVGPQQPVTTLTDTTLKRGDAVMTERGIRVFRGARHYPLEYGDFQPLAYAGKVSHRGDLLAIDRVLRQPQWSAAWKPSSPLVELPHLRRTFPAADTASRTVEAPQRS